MTDLDRSLSAIQAAEHEEWLSVSTIAQRLEVSTWQVRKWIDAGQFDEIAVFSRKLTRVSRAAYDRFVGKYRRASA